jgi:2-dehydro-3-deoxyglucarate aldolase
MNLKAKLRSGKCCLGAWLSVPSLLTVETLATCGFDWIAIDMEHSPFTEPECAAIFVAAERRDCAPVVRMPSADPYLARRLLDAGAQGLIIPVIESAAQFKEFAAHCHSPPEGRRGVCLSRANDWGDKFESYYEEFEPVLVPMIETITGIDAVEELAKLDHVDGIFLGPYDLSASLGRAGDFESADFHSALDKVRKACTDHGITPGIHQVDPDYSQLESRIEDGYKLIAFGTDLIGLKKLYDPIKQVVAKL